MHHSGLTDIDPDSHSLYIHGMTEKALKFSVSDLLRYPMVGGHMFLECSGNTWPQAVFPNAEQKPYRNCTGWCPALNGTVFPCAACWKKPV
ncbi:molybdopterin-dependent oxidoreductase [Aliamphritea spongicola]|nr:molybdopterin-dependent oxidoreductase [Aliamphritea spongicola]